MRIGLWILLLAFIVPGYARSQDQGSENYVYDLYYEHSTMDGNKTEPIGQSKALKVGPVISANEVDNKVKKHMYKRLDRMPASIKKIRSKLKKQDRLPQKDGSRKFRDGFKRLAKKCVLRNSPSYRSKKLVTVKQGQRLWLEGYDENWWIAFKKNGYGFLPTTCLK